MFGNTWSGLYNLFMAFTRHLKHNNEVTSIEIRILKMEEDINLKNRRRHRRLTII